MKQPNHAKGWHLLALFVGLTAVGGTAVSAMTGCAEECLEAGENCACQGSDCLDCCNGLSCTQSPGSNYHTCK